MLDDLRSYRAPRWHEQLIAVLLAITAGAGLALFAYVIVEAVRKLT